MFIFEPSPVCQYGGDCLRLARSPEESLELCIIANASKIKSNLQLCGLDLTIGNGKHSLFHIVTFS